MKLRTSSHSGELLTLITLMMSSTKSESLSVVWMPARRDENIEIKASLPWGVTLLMRTNLFWMHLETNLVKRMWIYWMVAEGTSPLLLSLMRSTNSSRYVERDSLMSCNETKVSGTFSQERRSMGLRMGSMLVSL